MRIVSLDTETFFDTKSGYGLKELGVSRYCRDDRFDAYLISVSDGVQTWAGSPKDFCWESLEGATILSHNQVFDQTVIREMQKRGLAPEFKFHEWLDTANLSSFLCNRRALDQASAFLLGEKLSKETRNYADGKHWRDIVADGRSEEMLAYARKDALACHQLYARFGHFWTPFERRLSDLTVRQSLRGVAVDTEKLNSYYKIVHEALARMQESLPWVKEGKKVLSPKAVNEECRRCQIPGPPIKSHEGGIEAFEKWYKTYGPRFTWIRTFSDIRSTSILLDFLEKVRTRVDENGILTFGQKYFAAHTGRWGGDAGINLQTLRKAPYFFGDDGLPRAEESESLLIEQCFSETGKYPDWVRHVVDIRSLFVPRKGRKFLIGDLSQIEPRVLRWLAGDEAMLASMRSGKSPYQSHAENTMAWTRGDLSALIEAGDPEAKKIYALAKARELALGFQAGWEKFISMAQMLAGIDITEGDPEFVHETEKFTDKPIFNADGTPKLVSGWGTNSKRIVKEYRESSPLIAGPNGIWKKLDTAFKNSVGGNFEMMLPSGRKMIYREVKEEWSRVLDEETGKYRNRRVVKAEVVKSGRIMRDALYGGILTENATQGTAREAFGEIILELDSTAGVDVLWGSHDEAVNEVDMDVTVEDVKRIMSKTPVWLEGCPITAKVVEAAAYCK